MLTLVLALAVGFSTPVPSSMPPSGARTLIDAGHWKRARAIVEPNCRTVMSASKCNFVAWSTIQLAFGDAAGALTAADKAIALQSGLSQAHLARGRALEALAADDRKSIYERITLYRQAREAFDRAAALSTKKATALQALAVLYATAPRAGGGSDSRAWDTAAEIEPYDPVAADLTRATILDWASKKAEVARYLQEAVTREPAAYRTNVAEATFDANFKAWTAAVRAAQAAVLASADRVVPYNVIAVADVHLKMFTALDALVTAAKRNVPDDRSPEFFAARALIGLNLDLPRARRYLDDYEAQTPEPSAPSLHDAEKLRAQLSILSRRLR